MSALSDLSAVECNIQVLQSYKDLHIDELSLSQFKLLDLSDRGGLKYPSELYLESITAWKIFVRILPSQNSICC